MHRGMHHGMYHAMRHAMHHALHHALHHASLHHATRLARLEHDHAAAEQRELDRRAQPDGPGAHDHRAHPRARGLLALLHAAALGLLALGREVLWLHLPRAQGHHELLQPPRQPPPQAGREGGHDGGAVAGVDAAAR